MSELRQVDVKELRALEDERDALAAHVVRLMGALELSRDRIALLAEIATNRGADVYAALDMWPEEMEQSLGETPATSLARVKAEWQAEALHKACNEGRRGSGLRHMAFELEDAAGVPRMYTEAHQQEMRRQAQEPTE